MLHRYKDHTSRRPPSPLRRNKIAIRSTSPSPHVRYTNATGARVDPRLGPEMTTANATWIACLQLISLAAAVMTPKNAKIRCTLVQYVLCMITELNPSPVDVMVDGEKNGISFPESNALEVAEQRQGYRLSR